MRQEDIESLPLFPDYTTETEEDNIYIFRSNVYIHKDTEEYLKVYLFPIESCYVAKTKTEKALVIKAHLKECFRLAKYFNTDTFDTTPLPLVATLEKREDDFLQKLHFDYT
jgi:hypothetical protein